MLLMWCALGLSASSALADFPYVGDGTAGEPASWALAPGHVPSNSAASAGSSPPRRRAAAEESPVESAPTHRTEQLPAGRAVRRDGHEPRRRARHVARAEPARASRRARPSRPRSRSRSGGPTCRSASSTRGSNGTTPATCCQLRKKVLLNAGELPAPRVDLARRSTPRPASTAPPRTRRPAATSTPHGGMPGGEAGRQRPDPLRRRRPGRRSTRSPTRATRASRTSSKRSRAARNPPTTTACRNGPPGMLTPEDLIIAFSDGTDHDGNGYADDIAGWDFLDDDNDPYDDVQYGHGTGEARTRPPRPTTARRDRHLPELHGAAAARRRLLRRRRQPLRAGDALRDRQRRRASCRRRSARSTTRVLARDAIDYAYDHGVAVIASAADEAAQHHNWPARCRTRSSSTRSKGRPTSKASRSRTSRPPTCSSTAARTSARASTCPIPPPRCSSEATGKSAGVAGLDLQRRAERLRRVAVRPLHERLGRETGSRQRLHARRRHALRDHRRRGPPADGLGQHRRHDRQRLLDSSAPTRRAPARPPPTWAKAARPTTSTPRCSPKRRAAWAWRPAAPTPT